MKSIAIICTHNGGKFINDQLKSMAQQIKVLDEIHVYDFGSTDDTRGIVQSFGRCNNVKLEMQTVDLVRGPCYSFFYAIRQLSSKVSDDCLVYLCDQDDYWLPRKNLVIHDIAAQLERQGELFIIHHDVAVVDQDLIALSASYYDEYHRALLSLDSPVCGTFGVVIGHTIATTGKMIKKISKIGYSDKYIMHDWAISYISEMLGRRIYVDSVLSLYRQHSSNLVGANMNKDNISNRIYIVLINLAKVERQRKTLISRVFESRSRCDHIFEGLNSSGMSGNKLSILRTPKLRNKVILILALIYSQFSSSTLSRLVIFLEKRLK